MTPEGLFPAGFQSLGRLTENVTSTVVIPVALSTKDTLTSDTALCADARANARRTALVGWPLFIIVLSVGKRLSADGAGSHDHGNSHGNRSDPVSV